MLREGQDLIRVSIEFNKQKMKIKLSSNTRILFVEEFLKRNLKFTPIEAIYLFKKEHRTLMVPAKYLIDYAREPTPQEIADGNPHK